MKAVWIYGLYAKRVFGGVLGFAGLATFRADRRGKLHRGLRAELVGLGILSIRSGTLELSAWDVFDDGSLPRCVT